MVSQAGLSSGHIFSFISALLFAKLGKCICYELNLRSDDYLNGGLTGFHDTGYACRFDHLIIHCGNVFYFQSQSCDAVVNACNVVLAAAAFQNGCCDCCEIIICQLDLLLCFYIIIFSTGGLQIPFLDSEEEYEVEYNKCCDTQRDDQKNRSIAPAEKLKPARKPRATVIMVKMPYSAA